MFLPPSRRLSMSPGMVLTPAAAAAAGGAGGPPNPWELRARLISSELRELQAGTLEYEKQRARIKGRHAEGLIDQRQQDRGRSVERRGRKGGQRHSRRRGRSNHRQQSKTGLQRWVGNQELIYFISFPHQT